MAAFTSQIFKVQVDFTRNLIGLSGLDLLLLIGQLFRIMAGQGSDGRSRAIRAHIFWGVLNIICIALFIAFLPYWRGGIFYLGVFTINALKFWLFVIHFVIFIIDSMLLSRFTTRRLLCRLPTLARRGGGLTVALFARNRLRRRHVRRQPFQFRIRNALRP